MMNLQLSSELLAGTLRKCIREPLLHKNRFTTRIARELSAKLPPQLNALRERKIIRDSNTAFHLVVLMALSDYEITHSAVMIGFSMTKPTGKALVSAFGNY